MIPSDMKQFIEDLFGCCTCDLPPAFITFTAIHPDGDRPSPSRHIPPGNQNLLDHAIEQLLAANQRGWGAYMGIASRQRNLGRWLRGGKHELAYLPALFVDLDQPKDALLRLGWFDLPASCILYSGRGYHAYWFLETPATDLVFADRVLRGLARHLNGDTALTVAQSMRLPGTINTKPGRDSAICTFFSYHPDRRYALNEFEPFLPGTLQHTRPARMGEAHVEHELPRSVLDELTAGVLHQLEGYWRSNGFIAARCPFSHEKDRPGMHFSYNAQSGWGYCFGKHGRIAPTELCRLFGITEPDSATHAA
jgi:hypothetical protein